MALSKRSFLGVAIEATPGTAAVTPTVYHPCKSIMKATKKREQLKDERGNRDAVYGVVDTTREGSTDPKGNWYNDSSPYFMIGAFGSVTTSQPDATNVPAARKHTMNLTDTPKSLTLFKSYDAAVYVGAYAVVEKWSLKFSSEGKLLENDVSLKHLYPVKYTGATLTPTFTTEQPFAGYSPTIKLNGVATTDIDEVTVEFDQKVTLWYPAAGSPDFVTVYYGERNVKCDFTARFDNDTIYQRYLNRVDDAISIDFQGSAIGKTNVVTIGAASAGTFTLTYGGQTTAPIAYNALASAVQSALTALSSVGASNAVVTGSTGGPYTVSFLNGTLNDGNVLTGSGTGLTGGAFAVGTTNTYNQELNVTIPVISYDTMDHDLGKDNVLIKAKASGISTPAGLISGYVQNTITSYAL